MAGAVKNGVDCQFGVKIQNIVTKPLNSENNRICCQIQAEDTIKTVDWLVIAAGLGTASLVASLSQSLDIRPVLGQALQVELAQPLGKLDFQPAITGNDVHIVPCGGSTYWIGATVEFPSTTENITPQEELLKQLQREAISF